MRDEHREVSVDAVVRLALPISLVGEDVRSLRCDRCGILAVLRDEHDPVGLDRRDRRRWVPRRILGP
jgi:hypothetical protein